MGGHVLLVQVIDYSPITSMYGAVHCSSQVVRRAPRVKSNYNAGSSLTRQLANSSLGSSLGLNRPRQQ